MKKTLPLLLMLLVSSAVLQAQTWTYLVYMVGSDLESKDGSATSDLFEMMEVGSNDDVSVVVTTGGADKDPDDETGIDWREIERYEILKDDAYFYEDFYADDPNMANPQNLVDFITWGIEEFPADKYALIMWDHGSGVDGFGNDENSGENLSIVQMQNAFEEAYQTTGVVFEVLGFDACLMANLEVAYSFKDYANYYVASEETEPGHGWDYTPVISALQADPSIDGAQLGAEIADGYLAHAEEENGTQITLSVTDMSKLDAVVAELDAFTNLYKDEASGEFLNPDIFTPYIQGRAEAEEYGKSIKNPAESFDLVDLYDWVELTSEIDPDLQESAGYLFDAIDEAVLYTVNDKAKPNSNGLSVFLPFNLFHDEDALDFSLETYETLQFSEPYVDFMYSYVENGHADVTEPEVIEDIVSEENVLSATVSSDDLDEAYVVLMETPDVDNDVLILGYALPDEIVETVNGASLTYEWDGYWAGINGHVAYISDMYEDSYDDENGYEISHLIIEVPAELNGEEVILTYSMDEEGYSYLESISPEVDENGDIPRETIVIEPGDELTLLYEGYNIDSEEDFWYVSDPMPIDSEDDIELEIVEIPDGEYLLGYYMSDYYGNETLLIDETIYTVGTEEPTPNPGTSIIQASENVFSISTSSDQLIVSATQSGEYTVSVYTLDGTNVSNNSFTGIEGEVPLKDQTGALIVSISSDSKVYNETIFIQ